MKRILIATCSLALIAATPILANAATLFDPVNITYTAAPNATNTSTQLKSSTGTAADLSTSSISQTNWKLSVRFHDLVRGTYGSAQLHTIGSSSTIPGSTSAGVTSAGTTVSLELSLVKINTGLPATLPVKISGLWRSN